MELKNSGLILENPTPRDWVVGGLSGISDKPVLQSNYDWTEFLPKFEPQSFKTFDTLGCVTFSALNVIETLIRRQYGYEIDWSDRYTAKMSGTSENGNTFSAVGESIRILHGLLKQELYSNTASSRSEFFMDIPVILQDEAKTVYKTFKFNYEYIPSDPVALRDTLKHCPIWTCGYAWENPRNGIYPRSMKTPNHAFMNYKSYDDWTWGIFDHYNEPGQKRLASDYIFRVSYAWTVTEIDSNTTQIMKFKEDTLYQLVDSVGTFYLMAAGKLRRDELSKILATYLMRAKSTPDGGLILNRETITRADLDGITVYNLKNQVVDAIGSELSI